MDTNFPVTAPGAYGGGADIAEGFADRIAGGIAAYFHWRFRRELPRWPGGVIQPRDAGTEKLQDLKYRLRRDGFSEVSLAECFGICGMVFGYVDAQVHAAAAALIRGGIVELADEDKRFFAIAHAAVARVLSGTPVHVITRSDRRSRACEEALRSGCEKLGISVSGLDATMNYAKRRMAHAADIVCATQRELALDYLRDSRLSGTHGNRSSAAVQRLSGDWPAAGHLLQRGLQCALVEDADMSMVDDARMPLVIAAEVDTSHERLLYEQALELARALEADGDYQLNGGEAVLTMIGMRRLERLVKHLGGSWASASVREDLIAQALYALHLLAPNRDYRVEGRRVLFPQADSDAPETETHGQADETLRKLVEVKEGCQVSGRRDVIARISVPRFFQRYAHLAGTCADARGIEREFWTHYRLKVHAAGPRAPAIALKKRVFATAVARSRALNKVVQDARLQKSVVVIALRTQKELDSIQKALCEAGITPGVMRGAGGESDVHSLASLEKGGSVLLTVYPAERSVAYTHRSVVPVHLVVTELHDAQRHIQNLCRTYRARSCELLLSLEDQTLPTIAGNNLVKLVSRWTDSNDEISPRVAGAFADHLQRRLETEHRYMRDDLRARDEQLSNLLAFSGQDI